MTDKSLKERLSGLEGKMEVLLGLLKEISEDTREQPSREEFTDLHNRVDRLDNILLKVGIISGIFGIIGGAFLTVIFKYILRIL